MVRLGLPCVGLVHDTFGKLAQLQAKALGMPDAPLLIYPQDLPAVDSPETTYQRALEVARRSVGFLVAGGADAAAADAAADAGGPGGGW